MTNEREAGWYWVKCRKDGPWEVAVFEEDGWWAEGEDRMNVPAFIGPRIEPPAEVATNNEREAVTVSGAIHLAIAKAVRFEPFTPTDIDAFAAELERLGYVVVPVEPTYEMAVAAEQAVFKHIAGPGVGLFAICAALSARPRVTP